MGDPPPRPSGDVEPPMTNPFRRLAHTPSVPSTGMSAGPLPRSLGPRPVAPPPTLKQTLYRLSYEPVACFSSTTAPVLPSNIHRLNSSKVRDDAKKMFERYQVPDAEVDAEVEAAVSEMSIMGPKPSKK